MYKINSEATQYCCCIIIITRVVPIELLTLENKYIYVHKRLIPKGVAEAPKIFLRDNNNSRCRIRDSLVRDKIKE
jgi:hypothetical protein